MVLLHKRAKVFVRFSTSGKILAFYHKNCFSFFRFFSMQLGRTFWIISRLWTKQLQCTFAIVSTDTFSFTCNTPQVSVTAYWPETDEWNILLHFLWINLRITFSTWRLITDFVVFCYSSNLIGLVPLCLWILCKW